MKDTFLPHHQLKVAIMGGLEAAIHCTWSVINQFQDRNDFCLLKLDFKNMFNKM